MRGPRAALPRLLAGIAALACLRHLGSGLHVVRDEPDVADAVLFQPRLALEEEPDDRDDVFPLHQRPRDGHPVAGHRRPRPQRGRLCRSLLPQLRAPHARHRPADIRGLLLLPRRGRQGGGGFVGDRLLLRARGLAVLPGAFVRECREQGEQVQAGHVRQRPRVDQAAAGSAGPGRGARCGRGRGPGGGRRPALRRGSWARAAEHQLPPERRRRPGQRGPCQPHRIRQHRHGDQRRDEAGQLGARQAQQRGGRRGRRPPPLHEVAAGEGRHLLHVLYHLLVGSARLRARLHDRI
mmetsp:Transcript_51795/g.139636  ORF Transcript_51795/g.139636 Transcript_51795/m.139636 type:complete len:294 (-) Transcript_51795:941-1822(-)